MQLNVTSNSGICSNRHREASQEQPKAGEVEAGAEAVETMVAAEAADKRSYTNFNQQPQQFPQQSDSSDQVNSTDAQDGQHLNLIRLG